MAAALWTATSSVFRADRVGLFYCDHGLREEASEEASFVRELASGLGFEFYASKPMDATVPESEADLRDLRKKALRSVMDAIDGSVACILTGHQGDDVAENLLFRLARGSGLAGMSGMRPVQLQTNWPVRIRPLLRWRRDDLRSALKEAGASWCEDASNRSLRYTRNRIRLDVLPTFEAALPERSVVDGLLSCHRELREIDAWTEKRAEACLTTLSRLTELPRSLLRPEPRTVQKRLLQKFVRRNAEGIELPERIMERVLSDKDSTVWHLSGGWQLEVKADTYLMTEVKPAGESAEPAITVLSLRPPDEVVLPSGCMLRIEEVSLDSEKKAAILAGRFLPTQSVWLREVELPLSVRAWQPGDRYQPLGAPGSRKLQDCFVDAGIEQIERRTLPIVCDANGVILWVPGLPPSHAHRLFSKTSRALRLTYKKS